MKNLILLLSAIFTYFVHNTLSAQSLTVEYSKIGIRATIPVQFKDASGIDGSWIGLYREADLDGNYLSYININHLLNGEIVFNGLTTTGVYNFRLFQDGGYTKIATSNSFLVVQGMIIDSSFGKSGLFTWDASQNTLFNGAKVIRLTNDGKLLVAGTSKTVRFSPNGDEDNDFLVCKLDQNGKLDPSFGNAGKLKRSFDKVYLKEVKAMSIQDDGKIIIGGNGLLKEGLFSVIVMIRLLENGQVDATFGENGEVPYNFVYGGEPPYYSADELRCMEMTPDQKILVGGGSIVSGAFAPGRPFIGRFLSNGMIDLSFGSSGMITPLDSFSWRAYVESIIPPVLGGDGSFIAIATAVAQFAANHQLLYKFNSKGEYDQTFGKGKPIVERRPGVINETYSKQILPMDDGGILMMGGNYIWSMWLIKRSAFDGSNYPDFGNQGMVTCDPAEQEIPAGMFINKNNINIAYAGNARQLSMSRYNLKGELDVVFGHPYYEFIDPTGGFIDYNVQSVLQQTKDRYIMAGYARFYSSPHFETFVMAFKDNPAVFTGTNEERIPEKIGLIQNYPNPFHLNTTIPFKVDGTSQVQMELYNLQGTKLGLLYEGKLNSGYYEVEIPNSFFRDELLSGEYVYSLNVKNDNGTQRLSKILIVR